MEGGSIGESAVEEAVEFGVLEGLGVGCEDIGFRGGGIFADFCGVDFDLGEDAREILSGDEEGGFEGAGESAQVGRVNISGIGGNRSGIGGEIFKAEVETVVEGGVFGVGVIDDVAEDDEEDEESSSSDENFDDEGGKKAIALL